MKRIELCVVFLGVLTCAALAADQQQLVDDKGNVISTAQFFLVVAGQNKLVELPQTNGTANLSAVANQPNITNQPIETWVYRCDQDPKWRVYYLAPGQTAPETKDTCDRQKGLVVRTGSGWRVDQQPGPYTLQVVPGAAPVSGPSGGGEFARPTFEASIAAGIAHAGNLSNVWGLEPDVTMFFGPFGFGGGYLGTGYATVQQSSGSSGGSTQPSGITAKFNAIELYGTVEALSWGPLSIAGIGGGLAFTERERFNSTVVITNPTGGTTTEVITTTRSRGGFSPYGGVKIEGRFTNHVAGQVVFKRCFLRQGDPLDQGVTMVLFGVAFSPQFPRGLFHLGAK